MACSSCLIGYLQRVRKKRKRRHYNNIILLHICVYDELDAYYTLYT